MKMNIDWQNILTIVVPLGAFLGWIYNRLDKKFDKIDKRFDKVDERFEKVDQRFENVDKRFDKVDEKLQILDSRVSRIEGQLTPTQVRYWEPKIVTKEEEK